MKPSLHFEVLTKDGRGRITSGWLRGTDHNGVSVDELIEWEDGVEPADVFEKLAAINNNEFRAGS